MFSAPSATVMMVTAIASTETEDMTIAIVAVTHSPAASTSTLAASWRAKRTRI